MFEKIVTAMAIVIILFLIFGCSRAQPYGEDIWVGYKHMEQSREKEIAPTAPVTKR